VLEDQTFGLKAGEWTAPIRTRQGFVILKVTDHVAPGVAPLKDVEPQIQEAMYSEQIQPALRAYLTKLREEAYIDIRAGYVDSGASAKQTKPVFTAYAPPVAKKKTVQQKKRFDRGTKYSTVAKTTAAPVATPAAVVTTTKNGKPVKPKKVKKEKVRFGQAPRNSLPAGPEETASGSDVGSGAASASSAPAQAAPGTAIAPLEASAQESSSDVGPNPLVATAPVVGKTRYSDRAKTDAKKKAVKAKKVKEKAAAAPAPASAEEKATQQTQAAPLGLNGDTAKKKKKKKVKGAPKERLQDKTPVPKAPLEETPSKAPDRGTPSEGVHGTGTPSPKATAPPASNPPDGVQPPTTPGSPTPAPPPQ
jgi:peptidyl-prolyl cis-trans isomerase SurA